MSEDDKRDRALKRVADNPDNHYEAICAIVRDWLINHVPPGAWIVSGQAFKYAMQRNPNLKPHDKRVMGPIMRRMAKEKYIIAAGLSTRERSHRGDAKEWKRTSYGASFNRKPFFSSTPPYIFRMKGINL